MFNKKNTNKIRLLAALLSAAAMCCGFAPAPVPEFETAGYKEKAIGLFISDEETMEAVLEDKKVIVSLNGEEIWQSPEEYLVQDMLIADIDGLYESEYTDDPEYVPSDELVLLLWKTGLPSGNGPFRAVNNGEEYLQYLYVFDISDDGVSQKWCSQYFNKTVDAIDFSNGRLFYLYDNGEESCWSWNGGGLSNISEGVKILAAGDNLIHSAIYKHALAKDDCFDFLYNNISDTVKAADFAVINQETPLVDNPSLYSGYPCFGTPVSIAAAIKKAGFDAVTLSTNHMFDKGSRGIDTTLETFKNQDTLCIGGIADSPYRIVRKNGIKIALLNYTYSTNGIPEPKGYDGRVEYLLKDEDKIREDILAAKEVSDAIIIFPHWGTEYSKKTDSMQKKWTELFYSCGVTAVVGTHPHVLEDCEMYSGEGSDRQMLVYYSLGNFISTNRTAGHNSGGIAEFTLKMTRDGVIVSDYSLTEINTDGISIINNDA